jgi:hypothetical protein
MNVIADFARPAEHRSGRVWKYPQAITEFYVCVIRDN